MAAQTVPAVGTPQPALRFAALGPTERLCASLVCSRVVFWNARDAVTSGVPVGGREGGGGGSFRRQVTSVRVTESWRPQLRLAGPLSRVDTDALVPLRRPAGRLWSHATAEPFSDKVIRGGVQG